MLAKLKTEKSIKYILISLLVIFFIFFSYLSIPSLFKFDKFKSNLEKKIYKEFSLNVTLDEDIKYVFFPSPRIIIKNIKIFDFAQSKNVFSNKNNIIIPLGLKNLIKLKNLSFNSLVIDDAVFNINYKNINNLNNFISKKLSKKNIKINNSKILVNQKNNLMFAININKLKIFHSNGYNRVSFGGKVFGTNLNGYYNKSFNKLNKSSLHLSLPKLGFTSKTIISNDDQDTNEQNLFSTIIQYPKTRIKMLHEIHRNSLKVLSFNIDSKLIDGSMKGYINLDPFYFKFNLDISQLYFIKIISNQIMDKFKTLNFFPINKKINGRLNINIKKFDSKSYMIDSGVVNLEFKNGILDLQNINLSINKTGNLNFQGFILQQNKKVNLIFNSFLDVPEPKKFGSQLMIPSRRNLKRVNISTSGKYNFDKSELIINKLFSNGKEIDKKIFNEYGEKLSTFLYSSSLTDKFNLFKLRILVRRLLE